MNQAKALSTCLFSSVVEDTHLQWGPTILPHFPPHFLLHSRHVFSRYEGQTDRHCSHSLACFDGGSSHTVCVHTCTVPFTPPPSWAVAPRNYSCDKWSQAEFGNGCLIRTQHPGVNANNFFSLISLLCPPSFYPLIGC